MTHHPKTLFSSLASLAILLWLSEPSQAEEGGSGTAKSYTFSAQVKRLPELIPVTVSMAIGFGFPLDCSFKQMHNDKIDSQLNTCLL